MVRYGGGGPFFLVCTSAAVPNYISTCYSYSVSLLIYVVRCFVGAVIVSNPMSQVLYIGINLEGDCILLMDTTGYFFCFVYITYLSRPWKFLLRIKYSSPAYFRGTYSMVGMVIYTLSDRWTWDCSCWKGDWRMWPPTFPMPYLLAWHWKGPVSPLPLRVECPGACFL